MTMFNGPYTLNVISIISHATNPSPVVEFLQYIFYRDLSLRIVVSKKVCEESCTSVLLLKLPKQKEDSSKI